VVRERKTSAACRTHALLESPAGMKEFANQGVAHFGPVAFDAALANI
jgi:hypothetical protein